MSEQETVQRMLNAYWQDMRPCEQCIEGQRSGMTAALRASAPYWAEKLLGPVTDEEWEPVRQAYPERREP